MQGVPGLTWSWVILLAAGLGSHAVDSGLQVTPITMSLKLPQTPPAYG